MSIQGTGAKQVAVVTSKVVWSPNGPVFKFHLSTRLSLAQYSDHHLNNRVLNNGQVKVLQSDVSIIHMFVIQIPVVLVINLNQFYCRFVLDSVKNPILVAEKVATTSRHCLFAGDGALKFALKQGLFSNYVKALTTCKDGQTISRG